MTPSCTRMRIHVRRENRLACEPENPEESRGIFALHLHLSYLVELAARHPQGIPRENRLAALRVQVQQAGNPGKAAQGKESPPLHHLVFPSAHLPYLVHGRRRLDRGKGRARLLRLQNKILPFRELQSADGKAEDEDGKKSDKAAESFLLGTSPKGLNENISSPEYLSCLKDAEDHLISSPKIVIQILRRLIEGMEPLGLEILDFCNGAHHVSQSLLI